MITQILIAVLVLLLLYIVYRLSQIESKSKVSDELVMWMKDLGKRVESSTQNVDQKLTQNMTMFNARLDKASEAMMHVQKSIGEFSEIGRSMKDLQSLLKSPKLRGNIGEQVLKELLAQCLPQDCFVLQYTFKNGEKVDAIVKTSQGLIPIDSKFPIENFHKLMDAETDQNKAIYKKEFERDVKKHIQDISRKYILSGEGTMDYALMYIPSESVYYEIINSQELYDFATQKRILPVSPMVFYAYLKAILVSFEGQRIQSQAKEILALLQSLKKDYEKSDEALSILNKHITNAHNQVSMVGKMFGTLGQKINSTTSLSAGVKEEIVEQEKLLE